MVFALHLLLGRNLLHLCAFLLTCRWCLLKHWIHRALFVFNFSGAKEAFSAGSSWFELDPAALINDGLFKDRRNESVLTALLNVCGSLPDEDSRLIRVRVPNSNIFHLGACCLLHSLLGTTGCRKNIRILVACSHYSRLEGRLGEDVVVAGLCGGGHSAHSR
jgi:hypothetical protein